MGDWLQRIGILSHSKMFGRKKTKWERLANAYFLYLEIAKNTHQ